MTPRQRAQLILVTTLLLGVTVFFYVEVGWVPVTIIGLPGVCAVYLWSRTFLLGVVEPTAILVPFCLSVAGFELHAIEEYLGHYGPAVGRLFAFAWTDERFVMICFSMAAALSAVAAGILRKLPLAGFVGSIFLTTRLAEVALFVFPLVRPSIEPDNVERISRQVNGLLVSDMPNYWVQARGGFYFPGMYTVWLTVIPAIWGVWRLWKARAISSA